MMVVFLTRAAFTNHRRPSASYVKGGFNGDIHAILRPIQRGMLQFVGFEVLAPQIIYGPVRMEQGQRDDLLAAYSERLKNIASEKPTDVGIY
jgi:putative NADPH-quinone reductase